MGNGRVTWHTVSPQEAGLAADLGDRLDAAAAAGLLGKLHAVLVARGGRLAVERYYAGEDEAWGRPLGRREFGPLDLHDLRSVTKSIVGLLYGIALAEGAVPPPEARLLEALPEYADLAAADPRRRRMTVEHALTMTLGTAWDEGLSYADPRNSEHAMELAPDRWRFALGQPLIAEPGSGWTYNGGATALLGRLIERGTGGGLHDFARSRLLAPLGIEAAEWVQGRDGAAVAASGLRLRPRDAAGIGQLALDGGQRDGHRIVPAEWLERSFTRRAEVPGGLGYGYQWWLGPTAPDGRPGWIAGFGNGGQRLFLGPRLGLVVMVASGAYNDPEAWRIPVRVITEFVIPSVVRHPDP